MKSMQLTEKALYILHQRYTLYKFAFPPRLNNIFARTIFYLANRKCLNYRALNFIKRILTYILLNSAENDTHITWLIYSQLGRTHSKFINHRIGDRLLKCRVYGEDTRKLLEKGSLGCLEWNAMFRYLEYLTQVYGYSHEHLFKFIPLISRQDLLQYATKTQQVRALSILLQLRQHEAAQNIYNKLPTPYLRANNLPVYIQSRAFELNWQHRLYNEQGASQYQAIINARSSFEEYIAQNSNSFCVIGNSPTEVGSKKGRFIDSHDVIIRFNNYDLNKKEDYGSKQNVWVRVANNEIVSDHLKQNEYLIFAANNFEYKRSDPNKLLSHPQDMGKKFTVIPPSVYRQLISDINCIPSTGLAMLYWIYTLTGKIPKEKVIGFTHISSSQDFRSHYFKDNFKVKSHIHNWNKERKFLDGILK